MGLVMNNKKEAESAANLAVLAMDERSKSFVCNLPVQSFYYSGCEFVLIPGTDMPFYTYLFCSFKTLTYRARGRADPITINDEGVCPLG